MFATDRIFGFFQIHDAPLRSVSLLLGINLILAGMIIFLFPEVLVFLIAFAFVVSGISVIVAAFRSRKRRTEQYSLWDFGRS
jgi:uncharacterized membrane protein HdeD (DUF308 family)